MRFYKDATPEFRPRRNKIQKGKKKGFIAETKAGMEEITTKSVAFS